MSRKSSYHPHVDGLRAVAVLSVLFYHFGCQGFTGGYIGVDVFFVISGFLITRLINVEITQTGRFDFARFYIRRMRRLFPALLATLLASLVAAAILFSPLQFRRFGRSLAATVFSVSNVYFWKESGYFDVDSRLKPLLHTWSLSVEEQFYLVWPVLMLLIARHLGARALPLLLFVIGAVSLVLNHVWVVGNFDPEYGATIFYMTPFRVFEFAIGAAGAFVPPRVLQGRTVVVHEVLMAVGLAMIGVPIVVYTDKLAFPYYFGLLPCAGAILVILSGRARVVGSLLTNPMTVGVGLISYSLYLVHWPVIVFYEYFQFRALAGLEVIALTAVSLFAAVLMYRFVERPFRRNVPSNVRLVPQKAFIVSSLSAMAAIGILGLQIGLSSGWVWRKPGALSPDQVAQGKRRRLERLPGSCQIGQWPDTRLCKTDRPFRVLVIGNSHELDGFNMFAAAYGGSPEVSLIGFGMLNDCNAALASGQIISNVAIAGCRERVARLNDPDFVASLDVVVYSSNKPFSADKKVSWGILRQLKAKNERLGIVVLGGYLNTRYECTEIYNRVGTFDGCKDARFVSYVPFGERDSTRLEEPGMLDYLYIDKARLLCPRGTLESCRVEAKGEPVTYDQHHLSLGFAAFAGEEMARVYHDDLVRLGFPEPELTKFSND